MKRALKSLSLGVQAYEDLIILHCAGRIVAGRESEMLRSVVESQTTQNICLDLASVHSMDAAGLGTLIGLRNWAEANGKRFGLLNPNREIRNLLNRTGLAQILQICCTDHSSMNFNRDEPMGLQRCVA